MNWLILNWIELCGAVLGLLYIFLEIKEKVWMWPVGIATSGFYIFVFFSAKFYADMSLQFYYVGVSIYGFYVWKYGGSKNNQKTELAITRIKLKLAIILTVISIALTAISGYLLDTYTDSPVPYWDALTTVLSIIGTWMIARKILEHWFVWIVNNAICVCLYHHKDLDLTKYLFLVYLTLAIIGLFEWQKSYKKNELVK